MTGGWPRLPREDATTKTAAPGFVLFEAWAFLLPTSGDFSQLAPQAFYSSSILHSTSCMVKPSGGNCPNTHPLRRLPEPVRTSRDC